MNKRGTPSKHDSLIKEGDAFLQDESKGQPLSLQYGEDEQIKILRSEQDSLKRDLGEKEETLRKLKMVKLYRSKVLILKNIIEIMFKARIIFDWNVSISYIVYRK